MTELADGTLDEAGFRHWIEQDYRYLLDDEMDLHREFAQRYTPFVEKYTSDEFAEAVGWLREFVDRCGEHYPGEHDAMREAFLTTARLEHAFWEMASTQEEWPV